MVGTRGMQVVSTEYEETDSVQLQRTDSGTNGLRNVGCAYDTVQLIACLLVSLAEIDALGTVDTNGMFGWFMFSFSLLVMERPSRELCMVVLTAAIHSFGESPQ